MGKIYPISSLHLKPKLFRFGDVLPHCPVLARFSDKRLTYRSHINRIIEVSPTGMAKLEERIKKKQKLCNEYFLGGNCHYVHSCQVPCSDAFNRLKENIYLVVSLLEDVINGLL